MYHRQHYHYFMIDFCYFSNYLLLFYLFFYPSSPHLFILNLANSMGPLLWAIVTWRNSLVFHDIDKITSVFIHIFPVIGTYCFLFKKLLTNFFHKFLFVTLVTYVVRWFPEMQEQYQVCANSQCTISFTQVIVPHLLFYLFWQIAYLLKTEVIDAELMKKRKELQTSFRWLSQDTKGAYFKMINALGPNFRIVMFISMLDDHIHLNKCYTYKNSFTNYLSLFNSVSS